MTTLNTQLGVKTETTYGTAVTVDKFFEFNSESIATAMGRVQSSGLRSGTRVMREDRFEPYPMGAAGNITLDVPTKGFGFWLTHMLGAIATGTVVDSNFAHTATVGTLLAKSFTAQVNRPLNPAGTNQAFTFEGGKVTSWELSCDAEGVLVASIDCDFEAVATGTALATASYPADWRIFSFAGATITLGGTTTCVKNFTVGMDNGLKTGDRFLCGSSLQHEPKEDAMRQITWSCEPEFSSLTEYNRFASTTRAGALAAIVATFNGPIAHAGTTLPSLVVTLPAARWDEGNVNVGGPEALMQPLSGVALTPTSGEPISVVYTTTDATP